MSKRQKNIKKLMVKIIIVLFLFFLKVKDTKSRKSLIIHRGNIDEFDTKLPLEKTEKPTAEEIIQSELCMTDNFFLQR